MNLQLEYPWLGGFNQHEITDEQIVYGCELQKPVISKFITKLSKRNNVIKFFCLINRILMSCQKIRGLNQHTIFIFLILWSLTYDSEMLKIFRHLNNDW